MKIRRGELEIMLRVGRGRKKSKRYSAIECLNVFYRSLWFWVDLGKKGVIGLLWATQASNHNNKVKRNMEVIK